MDDFPYTHDKSEEGWTCTTGMIPQSGTSSPPAVRSSACATCKTDLTDFTFLMPLRIDSEKRRENADTSISFILRHFDTTVIVVEDLRYFREIFKGKEEVSIKADAVN